MKKKSKKASYFVFMTMGHRKGGLHMRHITTLCQLIRLIHAIVDLVEDISEML